MAISPQRLTIYLYSAHRAVIFAIAQLSRWIFIVLHTCTEIIAHFSTSGLNVISLAYSPTPICSEGAVNLGLWSTICERMAFGLWKVYVTSNSHSKWFKITNLNLNLILFTLLLVHLILRTSPHHRHHLRSHHLSLPRSFTPGLKLISFTNPFLHSHSYFLPDCLHGSWTCTELSAGAQAFVFTRATLC